MPDKAFKRARIQGNLDGLCGLYAVVNAVRHMAPKRVAGERERELFHRLIAVLAEEDRLLDVICEGMTVEPLGRLVDEASRFLEETQKRGLARKLQFRLGAASLEEFWDATAAHLDEYGPGSVILLLGGKHDHWTCIGRMTEAMMTLIDSDGIKGIKRSSCTVAEAKSGRHHQLVAHQTYFLTRRPED